MVNRIQPLSRRIAAVWDNNGLKGPLLYSGVCQQAGLYPDVVIRLFDGIKPGFKKNVLHPLVRWQPDGLVTFIGDLEHIADIREALPKVPLVSASLAPEDLTNSVVTTDKHEIAKIVFQFFHEQGLRHFACFCSGNRYAAAIVHKACLAAGPEIAFLANQIAPRIIQAEPDGEHMRVVGKWISSLPKPVGIVTMDNQTGLYLSRLCRMLGFKVPQNVQLISLDDADTCMACDPHATSVQVPIISIGETAMRVLMQHIETPEHPPPPVVYVHGYRIIPRGSTGIIHAANAEVSKALNIIETDCAHASSVKDLRRHAMHTSRSAFYRHFRASSGAPPGKMLREARLKKACKMLKESTASITRVAEYCGYSSSSYFSQAFQLGMKMTPREFRRRHRKS